MHPIRWIYPALLCALLAGCSKPETPKTEAPLDPRDTVYGEQVKAIDKAKSVEGLMQQDADRTRETLEKEEAGK